MGISLQQLSNSINKVMAKVTALDSVIKNALDTHKDNTDIHVTSEDKTKWNGILQSSKDYADSLVSAINGFDVITCETELPTENTKEKTIYMLKKATSETGNLYDEYLYINSKWEKIGEGINADLKDYAKKTDLDAYEKTETLTATLANYTKTTDLDTKLQDYAKKNEVGSETTYTDEEVNSAVDTVLANF